MGVNSLSPELRSAFAAEVHNFIGIDSAELFANSFNTESYINRMIEAKGFGSISQSYYDLGFHSSNSPTDMVSWMHAVYPALISYISTTLNFRSPFSYSTGVPGWDQKVDNRSDCLRKALKRNPFLKVLIQTGYYDRACPYLGQRLNMWQIDPSGRFSDRISFCAYKGGHMFYMRQQARIAACNDLRQFIIQSVPKPGKPAKYE